MNDNYNANLFELKKFRPLNVSVYTPKIDPEPSYSTIYYQLLGRIAKRLTAILKTAVISEKGSIIVLERTIPESNMTYDINLPASGSYKIVLVLTNEKNLDFSDTPLEYGRIICKIVDLALVHFSTDFYKYNESSPKIIERGEGYFDESLRRRIGIEDGREYYRGVRVIDEIPHLLINRNIALRSHGNLLNELKALGSLWSYRQNVPEIDFYNPPETFVSYINRIFRNRSATVKRYSSRPIKIKEITWKHRAKERILSGDMSPVEYHKKHHGFEIEDKEQPLVIWEMKRADKLLSLFHVPELLVVGHNFKDLNMRISRTRTSQVFDLIQPNCADHLRKIFEIISKIDKILRTNYSEVYPSKIEFSILPKNINDLIIEPSPIVLEFKNTKMEISPPYGIDFYRKYSDSLKFVNPISGEINIVSICEEEYEQFINTLISDIVKRNECKINLEFVSKDKQSEINFNEYNHIITVSNNEVEINNYKELVAGKFGITHQNINTKNTNKKSIPQLSMQITLKLGGYPWYVINEDINITSIYSYRNPFSGNRFYLYNIMKSNGEIQYQSTPYTINKIIKMLSDIKEKTNKTKKTLVYLSYVDRETKNIILDELKSLTNNLVIYNIFQHDEVRIFSTYRPRVVSTSRRRRRRSLTYPIEAIENAPQGTILQASDKEFYYIPTSSTKVRTYFRGCPTAIRFNLLHKVGKIDLSLIYQITKSMSVVASTSGHVTRLPAPLYYLKIYANYANKYPLPIDEKVLQSLYYV